MSDRSVDERDLHADLDAVTASHAALVEHLRTLEAIDPATPSRLPDWTVGHVLTHLARHADGHLNALRGLAQYPQGFAGRDADIEAGAVRSWDELVDDVDRTRTALDDAYRTCDDWTGTVAMVVGDRPKVMLPFLRQREVEVHRVDLGLGYEFALMPSRYVRKDLRLMEMLWRARKPMGLTPLPPAALALPPATRLAWMMGRVAIDGLAPADLFGA